MTRGPMFRGAISPLAGILSAAIFIVVSGWAADETRPTRTGDAKSRRPPGVAVDDQNRLRLPITDQVPPRLPAEGVPAGWELIEFSGRAAVELVRSEVGVAVRLESDRTSFALHRDAIVDLRKFPFLSWAWRVNRLPDGGDVRDRRTDDQAAQVYVIFPRWPTPRLASDVIGYVWDSRAPVGTRVQSPKASNVKVIVLESGRARIGTWQHEVRNVAEDYQALFGRQPPRVGKVALMIDSNDTASRAEALIADLAFSRTR